MIKMKNNKQVTDPELESLLNGLEQEEAKTDKVTKLFKTNDKGAIRKTLSNIRIMIEHDPAAKGLGFNEFTNEITLKGEPITDQFIRKLRVNFDKQYTLDFTEHDVFTMVDSIARDNTYHPIKNRIHKKEWDGIERAETLFIDYLGANDDRYIRETTRKWLAGSVARIYEPGVKFEIIPILQGEQGIGKSTIVSKLGGDYFTDSLQGLGNSKDDYQTLIGTWIAELGELSSLSSTKVETIKGFTSATQDKIRLPYERMTRTFKRTVSFIGTTNPKEYLKDLTGNRRFFPIPLDKKKATKDIFKLDEETIQQIWAESYCYYKAGEQLFVPDNDELTHELASSYRQEATEQDMIRSDIEDYINMGVLDDWNNQSIVTKQQVFTEYQAGTGHAGTNKMDRTSANEIARVVFNLTNTDHNQRSLMKQINLYMGGLENWKYQSVFIKGRTVKGYKRLD